MSTIDEQTPLFYNNDNKRTQLKRDTISKRSITTGLGLFVALILSVLVKIPLNVFTFHPFFMTLFIVLATEGVALLQPTSTPSEKKRGLKFHAFIQTTSYLSVITGFSFIFYNKVISGKPHFESLHGKMGLFVFTYLFVQLAFGFTAGFYPQLFGSVEKGKSLWKFHRIFGYILLVLVFSTALLGARADYMYNNLYSPHLYWLYVVAIILVVAGISGRIRTSKWGLN